MTVHPERPSLTMPAELTRRAEAVAAGDAHSWQVPTAADAATLILLRDGSHGPEVFLQRRAGGMAFAPGVYVFPGGRVESSDAELPWVGPLGEPFALPVGSGVCASFRALTGAAVRETWEEAGVLLVDAPSSERPGDADFGAWLTDSGRHIDGRRFGPWSHWITPEVERRRFDTRFLVTALPAGELAVDMGVESDHSSWFRPQEALDHWRLGDLAMLPPTTHALTELASFDTVSAILTDALGRRPRPMMPRPVLVSGAVEWRLIDAYTGEVIT